MGLYCGIDWASTHHDVAVIDGDGRVVARERVSNDAVGFSRLPTLLAVAGDAPRHRIPVAIETDHGLRLATLRETGRVIYAAFAELPTGGLARADALTILAAAPTPAQAAKLTPARLRQPLIKASRRRDLDRDVARLRAVFADTCLHRLPTVENAMGIQRAVLLRHFNTRRAAADWKRRAQRHLFRKLLGQLQHCLQATQPYKRTPSVSTSSRTRGLTLNHVRCLSLGGDAGRWSVAGCRISQLPGQSGTQ